MNQLGDKGNIGGGGEERRKGHRADWRNGTLQLDDDPAQPGEGQGEKNGIKGLTRKTHWTFEGGAMRSAE